jgi:hypothetical protein
MGCRLHRLQPLLFDEILSRNIFNIAIIKNNFLLENKFSVKIQMIR